MFAFGYHGHQPTMNDAPQFQPRKRPSQVRSRVTVDAILEATVQVMLDEGFERTTTRRVAERAGVSVGTLYQYFPNREALVAELLRGELERLAHAVSQALAATAQQPLGARLRAVIGALARVKFDHAALHRALTLQLPRVQGQRAVSELQQQLMGLARSLLEHHADELDVQDLDTACFIVVHAVDGALSAAMAEGGERLASPGFVDQLSRVAMSLLSGAPCQPARPLPNPV